MSLALLFHYLMLNMFQMLIHLLSGACDLFVELCGIRLQVEVEVVLLWFDVCWFYVVVWLWWCGIRLQVEALVPQPAYEYHTTTAKPQRKTNTHRTRAIQPMK